MTVLVALLFGVHVVLAHNAAAPLAGQVEEAPSPVARLITSVCTLLVVAGDCGTLRSLPSTLHQRARAVGGDSISQACDALLGALAPHPADDIAVLMARIPQALGAIRVAGGAYLIWLGGRSLWRAARPPSSRQWGEPRSSSSTTATRSL